MRTMRSRAWGLGVLGILLTGLSTAPAAQAQEVIQTPKGPGFLIYGNYCGPGNRGPRYKPIDALDLACAHHDACWPAQPAALPTCACNERLHVEADAVARNPRAPGKTRETARFISDFASAIPCEDPRDGLPTVPGIRRPPVTP
jgi:hypothetical protein